ncbi:BQ2448_6964 [Microbotryum intermedium]|uniref:BQ2448_6964 protein n=1 Tax=Microbotryum intermedium TaxID=269621 RepID=A0A238FJS2_9BASI|nr:BQ2448_6964 [Microbotryum intermedium]
MIFENCMPPAITQSRFDPSHLVGGTHAIGAKVIWDQLDSVKPFKSTISDTNTRLSNVEVNGERDAAYIKLSRKAFAGSERPAIKSAHDVDTESSERFLAFLTTVGEQSLGKFIKSVFHVLRIHPRYDSDRGQMDPSDSFSQWTNRPQNGRFPRRIFGRAFLLVAFPGPKWAAL